MKKEPKFLNVMRISAFLLFLCVFSSFAAKTSSQNARVNISGKNLTIGEFIDQVEKQTDYLFVYSKNEVNTNDAISVKSGNKTVAQYLSEAFGDSNVNYAFENDYIVLTKNANPVVAQEGKTISGVVNDEFGPVAGANVIIKGTTNGTMTDMDGNFTITNVPEGAVLQVSFIGYLTKELPVGNQTTFNVMLTEDSQALEEVVVVGYGVQRKSDVTGSISVTKADEMLKQQSFSALDGLKGKAAGVNIFSNSGQPGGSSRVIIRGMSTINSSTDPLYVVDGVVMEDFKFVNPNDIERIEVLKDASSAAIYGARGANGVIMVTTKRGSKEEGVQVSYSGSVSVGTMSKYMDLLDANEWMDAYKIASDNWMKYAGENKPMNLSNRDLFNADGTPIYNTDWQREATRTAFSHNHQLNIQQGGKKSSMGAFLNYTDQQGIMLNSYMKRINAKMAYDADPMSWLSTSVNLLVNHTWGNEAEETGGHQMPRRSMIEMVPWLPVQFPDGSWSNSTTGTDGWGLEGMANPVHVLKTQKRMRYRTQMFGNAALTFHILPGLDLKTQIGLDAHNNKESDYSPKDLINLSYPNGSARIKNINTLYWQEETYLTYNKTWEKHRLNAMAGLSWQQRTERWNESKTEGFADDFFGTDNMGAGTIPSAPTSAYSSWAMNSYFLRGSYSYNDKYMATVTGRVDGSSRFGDNNKYAFFPSVGLGWLISNEDFMKNATVVDQLKLHTSFGVTGNTEIGIYKSLATISSGNDLLNGGRVPVSNTARLANPDLKWEKTNQFDIGFNLNLFRNRLNFDISYYYKLTTDLLLERPVPHTTGFTSVMDNIGKVANQGLDFMVNTVNIDTKDFGWSSTLNFNYNKNEIKKLGENDEDILTGPWFISGNLVILRKGESLGSFWGYKREGIWGEDEAEEAKAAGAGVGQPKRSKDREILGKGLPDVTGSFINNFRYKNFDLTVDLQFVLGVDVYQQFLHSTEDRFGIANALSSVLSEGWTPANTNTMIPALYSQNSQPDSHWVANGSYLRANLIQLGYTFEPSVLKALHLGSLRAYFSVNNAFCITSKDFKGYDPEGTSQGTDQWGQNIMFFQYPKPRTYTLGVNVSF